MLGIEPWSESGCFGPACQMFHPDYRARVWQDVVTLIGTGKPPRKTTVASNPLAAKPLSFSASIPIKEQRESVLLIPEFSQDVTEQRTPHQACTKSRDLMAQPRRIAHFGIGDGFAGRNTDAFGNLIQR